MSKIAPRIHKLRELLLRRPFTGDAGDDSDEDGDVDGDANMHTQEPDLFAGRSGPGVDVRCFLLFVHALGVFSRVCVRGARFSRSASWRISSKRHLSKFVKLWMRWMPWSTKVGFLQYVPRANGSHFAMVL